MLIQIFNGSSFCGKYDYEDDFDIADDDGAKIPSDGIRVSAYINNKDICKYYEFFVKFIHKCSNK